eukprot:392943-Prorocentrum_minimum.AAC.1
MRLLTLQLFRAMFQMKRKVFKGESDEEDAEEEEEVVEEEVAEEEEEEEQESNKRQKAEAPQRATRTTNIRTLIPGKLTDSDDG